MFVRDNIDIAKWHNDIQVKWRAAHKWKKNMQMIYIIYLTPNVAVSEYLTVCTPTYGR